VYRGHIEGAKDYGSKNTNKVGCVNKEQRCRGVHPKKRFEGSKIDESKREALYYEKEVRSARSVKIEGAMNNKKIPRQED